MKKNLLSVAVVAALVASTAASAAVVYDKDGTVLKVGARIEAQWYNGGSHQNNAGKAGNNDSSIINWTRFHFEGSSQITPWATAFGKAEWDADDNDSNTDGLSARDQFIGVNFGEWGGKLQVGRYKSLLQTVVGITDNLGGDGESGKTYVVGDSRNAGKLTYTWSHWGFLVGVEYQSAKNGYKDHTFSYNLESGYNILLGYTSPEVLFGPIAIKAGYAYMEGQDDLDYVADVDDQKGWGVSLAWGVPSKGLFIAAEYSENKTEFHSASPVTIAGVDTDEVDQASFELALKYTFDFGLSLATGYQWESIDNQTATYKSGQIPVVVEYNFNPNFKVYAQANFGVVDSEYDGEIFTDYGSSPTYGDGNAFAIGARYTF